MLNTFAASSPGPHAAFFSFRISSTGAQAEGNMTALTSDPDELHARISGGLNALLGLGGPSTNESDEPSIDPHAVSANGERCPQRAGKTFYPLSWVSYLCLTLGFSQVVALLFCLACWCDA